MLSSAFCPSNRYLLTVSAWRDHVWPSMHGLHNFTHYIRAFMSHRQKICFQWLQWNPCYCVSAHQNHSASTASGGDGKVPCYFLNKNIGIAHTDTDTHRHTHPNTQAAWFCLNDPFKWWLVSSEQSKPPSPSLLAGSLSTHNCYASSFLRQWCHGALHCSIGWRNAVVTGPGSN